MQTQAPALPSRSTGFIVLMVVLACVSTTFLLATPGFVVLIASQWFYSASQIGLFVTAESVGNALGPLVLAGLLSRAPVRLTVIVSALAFALANLGTALHPSVEATLALRAVSGFSSGILAGVAVRYLALSANSERNLTWLVISQTIYSSLLLAALLPAIGDAWQATGAFGFLAIQALLSVFMFRLFRGREPLAVDAAQGGFTDATGSLISLAALLTLNTAVGVTWTFIEQRGQGAGIGPEWVGRTLGGGNLLSIVACAAVPAAVRRGDLFRWAVRALLGCAAAALVLALASGAMSFIGASLLFVVAWAAAATLLMAAVPRFDGAGRFVTLIPSALCIGNAVGAALGGALMDGLGAVAAFGFAAVCCALSAGLAFALGRRAGTPNDEALRAREA